MSIKFKCGNSIYLDTVPDEYKEYPRLIVDFDVIQNLKKQNCNTCQNRMPYYNGTKFTNVCIFEKVSDDISSIDIFNKCNPECKCESKQIQSTEIVTHTEHGDTLTHNIDIIDLIKSKSNSKTNSNFISAHGDGIDNLGDYPSIQTQIENINKENNDVENTTKKEICSILDLDKSRWTIFEDCALEQYVLYSNCISSSEKDFSEKVGGCMPIVDDMFGTKRDYHSNYKIRMTELGFVYTEDKKELVILRDYEKYRESIYEMLNEREIHEIVDIAYAYGKLTNTVLLSIYDKYPAFYSNNVPLHVVAKIVRNLISKQYQEYACNKSENGEPIAILDVSKSAKDKDDIIIQICEIAKRCADPLNRVLNAIKRLCDENMKVKSRTIISNIKTASFTTPDIKLCFDQLINMGIIRIETEIYNTPGKTSIITLLNDKIPLYDFARRCYV